MKPLTCLGIAALSLTMTCAHAELNSRYISACPALVKTEVSDAKTKKDKDKPLDERTIKVLKKVSDLMKAEDFSGAKEQLLPLLEKIEKKPWDSSQVLLQLAYVESQLDDNKAAAEHTEKAIATNALSGESLSNAWRNLVSLHSQNDEPQRALAAVDNYLSTTTAPVAEMYVIKGNIFYQEQQYEQAICPMYYGYSQHATPKIEWLALLINLHMQLEDWDGAIALQKEMINKTPGSSDNVVQLANIYLRAKKNSEAFALLEKAEADGVLKDEKDIKNLAALYWNNQQFDRTAAALERGIQKGVIKNTDTNWKNIAQAWRQHGDHLKAAQMFSKGGELSSNGELNLFAGERYSELNKWDDAIAEYNKAINKGGLGKNEGHTYLTLAYAQFRVSKFKEALKSAQKAATFASEKKTADPLIKQIQGQLK